MTHPHHPPIDQETQKLARDAIRSTEDVDSRLEKLEIEYAKLAVITESLWKIVSEKLHLQDATLKTAMHEILQHHDALDQQKIDCDKCHMTNSAKKKTCIYCGSELMGNISESPFL